MVTMTESAAFHARKMLDARKKGIGIRVGIKKTGCNGFAYKIEFCDQVEQTDQTFESHGVVLVVDPKSLALIDGTEINYVKKGLSEGFEFSNPLEQARCGCGESFSVQK